MPNAMAILQRTMKILGTLVLGKDHAFDWHAKSFALDILKNGPLDQLVDNAGSHDRSSSNQKT
jgi:hypothetical protein